MMGRTSSNELMVCLLFWVFLWEIKFLIGKSSPVLFPASAKNSGTSKRRWRRVYPLLSPNLPDRYYIPVTIRRHFSIDRRAKGNRSATTSPHHPFYPNHSQLLCQNRHRSGPAILEKLLRNPTLIIWSFCSQCFRGFSGPNGQSILLRFLRRKFPLAPGRTLCQLRQGPEPWQALFLSDLDRGRKTTWI